MIWVEPGTFTMGDLSGTGAADERPSHQVTLTKGFYLGKYEVTKEQYELVMTGNDLGFSPTPYAGGGTGANTPIVYISYNEVVAFINRFNQQQAGETQIGWEYILPTEAQWEYARRAGSTSVWGNFDLSDGPYDLSTGDIYANAQTVLEFNGSLANYNAGAGSPFSHKDVGQYPPNSWGFHDMSGSASEWVADWLGSYSSDSQTDPQGPSIGTDRVIRGGSLENQRVHQTSSNRGGSPPEWKRYSTGFRLAYMYTNKVPSDLNSTAPLTIAENQPIGTIVGEFNATDPDPPTSPQVIYSDGFEAGSLRSDWNASGVIGNAYAVVDSNKSLYGTKSLHLGIGTVTAPTNSSEVMLHLPFGQTLHKGSVEMDLWVNEDANHSSFVWKQGAIFRRCIHKRL